MLLKNIFFGGRLFQICNSRNLGNLTRKASSFKPNERQEGEQTNRYVNEQITFINNEIIEKENKIINWTELKENLFKLKGNVNNTNVDAILLKMMVQNQKFEGAKSYIEYILNSNREINLGAIKSIMWFYHAYSKNNKLDDNDKKYIWTTYDEVMNKHKILDYATNESFLAAFTAVNDQEKCLKIFENLSMCDLPSNIAYSLIVQVLFENNNEVRAKDFINDCISRGRSLRDEIYFAWIDYCIRNFSNETEQYNNKLNNVLECISHTNEPITKSVALKLKHAFDTYLKYKSNLALVNLDGRCDKCNKNLQSLKVSLKDFELLQSNFKEKVLIGDNTYVKTSPAEIEKFMNYIEKSKPFDIVIDSLNVSYCIGKGSNWEKSKFLADVVGFFLKKKKKVFVLGRKHMLRWPMKNMELVMAGTKTFLTDDLSQDDPFFLLAALLSGPNTDIVSRDKLRGHRFLLGDVKLRSVFLRWQWQHQWQVYTINRLQPVVHSPLKFTPCAQSNDAGCWHVPYQSDSQSTKDPMNAEIPKQWLCIRK